jgi:hypothetical protein
MRKCGDVRCKAVASTVVFVIITIVTESLSCTIYTDYKPSSFTHSRYNVREASSRVPEDEAATSSTPVFGV